MKKPIWLLFVFLLRVLHLPAQEWADFDVTHYTNENGLPQNSVNGVQMDKDGFLWIATEAGLVRFDGQRFKVYDRDHYPALGSNRITFVGLDTSKTVCFGDGFRTCYTFDRRQRNRIQPISWELFLKKSNKWIGHFMSRYDSVCYMLNERKLWQVSTPDCFRYAYTNDKFYYWDKYGLIWCVDTKGRKKQVFVKGLIPRLGSFKVNRIVSYGLYEHNATLFLFLGKGVYRLQEEGDSILKATLVLETTVADISQYRNYPEQNLQVIGTPTDGIYLYRRKQFKAYKHSNGFGNFYPQAPFGDSGVLTNRGLVYPSFSLYNYPIDNGTENFRALLLDSRGHYWVNKGGSHSGYKISELDQNMKEIRQVRSFRAANCIRETPDGHIWMSCFEGKYLGYVQQDTVIWLPADWGPIPTKSIVTFLPISKEIFWVAGSHTLTRLNIKTGQQIHYPGMEKFLIESLYLDKQNVLWMGTEGSGLFALKKDKIYKLPLDKSGGLKDVHAFMEDKNGSVWMSTNNGLFRCKKEDLDNFIAGKITEVYYQCFKKKSGFNTNEFNGSCTPSAIVLGNGKFSFPSLDGLVQFRPDSICEAFPTNGIFIDRLLVDGKQEFFTGNTINIDPSFKYLEVQVSSPYFGNPDNQQLEYKLSGLDNDWHSLKEDNTVVFNKLNHGDYDLQFRKRAGFGKENVIVTSIPLSVQPFFYQTWFFRIALIVLLIISVFLIIRIRYTYLIKKNKRLEEEISARTIKLHNANLLKEKILMMVGHDLQSPLHFLSYLSQLSYDSLSAKQHEKASEVSLEIKNTSRKIYSFVEEFNLWARIQDEKFNLKEDKVSLPLLLEELNIFFKEMLGLNGNKMELVVEGDLEVQTSRALLKAILRNLVDNANKHTNDGVIQIICATEGGKKVRISVADTGNGMSVIELHKLRALILNAKELVSPEPDSSLGYQFIIDFAYRLGAKLEIDSEKGKGTTVSITNLEICTTKATEPSLQEIP
jgi:signal transduction histidine kinase/streptogramin lyase